jgi:hypothetical protein
MLIYNSTNNEIEFVPPAEELDDVQKLKKKYNRDTLLDIMKYVYNVYSPYSIFSGFTPEERKERVLDDILHNKYVADFFDKDNTIKAFVDKYIDMSLTVVQRDYERTKRDIEDLHEHISNIPFVRKATIRRQIDFKDDDGKTRIKEVDVEIEIDNSEEKIKALSVREKLYKLHDILKKMVDNEEIERETTAKTMFET